MRAIVVGGTGFVGMNVARALVADGHDVIATRRERANTLVARKLRVPLVRAELHDEPALAAAMTGRDVVFMCAAHYPRFSLDEAHEVAVARARVRSTLEAARRAGVRRYVLTSSVTTHPRGLVHGGVYHAVKHAIEDEAARARDLEVVVLRPTGILGEMDVKVGTGTIVVALATDRLPFFVDGTIDVVDADDVARAHVAAATRASAGARLVVAGHTIRVRALLDAIADELAIPMRSIALPGSIAAALSTLDEMRCAAEGRGRRPFLPRELVDVVRQGAWVSREDAEHARATLGLPAPTPLELTIRKSCRWYARNGYLRASSALAPARSPARTPARSPAR